MNAGIIGCGLMGRQRGRSLALLPQRPRVEAVYDPNPANASALGEALNCTAAASLEELLANPKIQVAIVAVPHWAAKQTVLAALRAGKHVLCEKPLGLSAKDAEEIVRAAETAGLHLTPGFNYRYYPGFRTAAQLLREGRIGKLTHIRCHLGHGARPGYDQEWKTNKQLCGGGALLDPGIHVIDLIRFIAGEIQSGGATLFRSFWNIDVEDNAFINLDTVDGCRVQLHISITEWKSRCALDLFGHDGCILVRGRSGFYGPQVVRLKKRWDWLPPEAQEEVWEYPAEDLSFAEEMKAFWERMEAKDSPNLATGKDGHRAIEIVERLYQSCPVGEQSEREWRELSTTAL